MKKKIHAGDLIAETGKVYDFTEITGYLDAQKSTGDAFPYLTTVGRDLYAAGTSSPFAALTTVGRYLDAHNSSSPFAALTTVGRCLDARNSSSPFAALTTVGGDLDARNSSSPFAALTTVGGGLAACNSSSPFAALTTVGGYLDAEGAKAGFSKVKVLNDSYAEKIKPELFAAFHRSGYLYADGILAKIIAHRGKVWRVVIAGKMEVSYVVEDGQGNFSHGATLKEARDSLIYKLTSRDTSEFADWNLTKKITKAEAIQAYRAITGACEGGVRHFCESRNVPEKMTVADAIKMTEGQYNSDAFKKFFTKGN